MSNDLARVGSSPFSLRRWPWLGLLARWAAAGMIIALVAAVTEERTEIQAQKKKIDILWPVVFSPRRDWTAREITFQGRTPFLPGGWAAATGKILCGGGGKAPVQCSLPSGAEIPKLCVVPEAPEGKWPGGAPYGIRPVRYGVPEICPKNLPFLPSMKKKK